METKNTFTFELVSPEARLISESVWHVGIPAEEGDVGVRAGHMPLVLSVRPGVVEVIRTEGGSGTAQRVFVAGGFADISGDHCTLLAEQAVDLQTVRPERVETEIRNLTEDLALAESQAERDSLTKRIDLAKALFAACRS